MATYCPGEDSENHFRPLACPEIVEKVKEKSKKYHLHGIGRLLIWGLLNRNGYISVSGYFIGAGRKRGKGGMTFKARCWPDLRIHPMPVTCFIILLGSVLGTNQIIKS